MANLEGRFLGSRLHEMSTISNSNRLQKKQIFSQATVKNLLWDLVERRGISFVKKKMSSWRERAAAGIMWMGIKETNLSFNPPSKASASKTDSSNSWEKSGVKLFAKNRNPTKRDQDTTLRLGAHQ